MTLQEAKLLLAAEIMAGHVINYAVDDKCFECGRRVFIETPQGWCPEPFWQEFQPYPHD